MLNKDDLHETVCSVLRSYTSKISIFLFCPTLPFTILSPVLHHCVIMFFWSSEIMDCVLFTFKKIAFRSCSRGRQRCGIIFINIDEQLQ